MIWGYQYFWKHPTGYGKRVTTCNWISTVVVDKNGLETLLMVFFFLPSVGSSFKYLQIEAQWVAKLFLFCHLAALVTFERFETGVLRVFFWWAFLCTKAWGPFRTPCAKAQVEESEAVWISAYLRDWGNGFLLNWRKGFAEKVIEAKPLMWFWCCT